MAFKNLAQRIINISRTNCCIPSSAIRNRVPTGGKPSIALDPGDNSILRRLLHKNSIFQPSFVPEIRSFLIGESLKEKLRSADSTGDRIRFDGLALPKSEGLTVDDAQKLLRVPQLEIVKTKLREMDKIWIPYSDFISVCSHDSSDPEQGTEFAKILDQSGTVIVLGKVVFLKPEQVAKTIEDSLFLAPAANPDDGRRKQFEEMESLKLSIDQKAEYLVRRELWGGLGFLIIQTVGFMRLTYWELSWDVMEPICFYVTSIYFMAGYAFFLMTSKEPSFGGFFGSRFSKKQEQLMKMNNFNIDKYNELKKSFCLPSMASYYCSSSNCCEGKQLCALNH